VIAFVLGLVCPITPAPNTISGGGRETAMRRRRWTSQVLETYKAAAMNIWAFEKWQISYVQASLGERPERPFIVWRTRHFGQ